ncbi:MAG: hypothetical protein ACREH3_13325 [Geminicoccales bacterium]
MDPQGRARAQKYAALLAKQIDDAEVLELNEGLAVIRQGAAAGEQPYAFIYFAPLAEALN